MFVIDEPEIHNPIRQVARYVIAHTPFVLDSVNMPETEDGLIKGARFSYIVDLERDMSDAWYGDLSSANYACFESSANYACFEHCEGRLEY